ncbi:hypothetical protein DMTZ50_0174, partial [Dehalococcoides mccartyi]|nr:hypothetical protein [Dehalococcoides mccartyi]
MQGLSDTSNSPSDILRTNALGLTIEGIFLALVETGEDWLWPELRLGFMTKAGN